MARKISASKAKKGAKINSEWNRLSASDPGQPMLKTHVDQIAKRVKDAHASRKGKKKYDPVIGAVVGSVQSGKTSTMIGLSGRLFAQGYQVITILTGLRNDLRYQSARRFYRDLFDSGEATYEFIPVKPNIQKVTPQSFTHPKGQGNHGTLKQGTDFSTDLPLIQDINTSSAAALELNALNGVPVIQFVKKIGRRSGGATLGMLKNVINMANNSLISGGHPPLRHAVIDDECDEATVGGSTRAAAPPEIRDIVNIGHGTYVGFTATAQANIFTDGPTNPLQPQDFLELLRYPADYNIGLPRSDVAWNPGKDKIAYCGGYLYHEWNDARGKPDYFREDLSYAQAVLSYIVSGAIRLANRKGATFPSKTDRTNGYLSKSHVLPEPHTMLVHTSHKISDHFIAAGSMIQEIHTHLKSGKIITVDDDVDALKEWNKLRTLLIKSTKTKLKMFQDWYDKFQISTTSARIDSPGTKKLPPWKDVSKRLEEVISNIDLRIVNSKTKSENLLYDVSDIKISGVDKQSIPQDIYPLVISGNKMGRGITLDGLTTTFFDRHPKMKVQDTIIQRQRWFGYHGERIGLIRIFCHENEWAILRSINDDDESLKQEIAKRKHLPPTSQKWATFFTGGSALTRKAKKGSMKHISFDYSPISHGYFQIVNNPIRKKSNKMNLRAFDDLFKTLSKKGLKKPTTGSAHLKKHFFLGKQFDSGTSGGTPITHGSRLSAVEIAEIMESFYIHGHNPDPSTQQLGNPKALGVTSGFKKMNGKGQRLPKLNVKWNQDYLHVALYLRWWAYHQPVNVPEFNLIIRNGASTKARPVKDHLGTGMDVEIGRGKLNNHVVPLDTSTAYTRPATMGGRGAGQISDGRLDDMKTAWGPLIASSNGQEDPRKSGQPGLLILDLLNDGVGDIVRMGLIVPEGGPVTGLAVQI
jgi:hypothetical protein